MSEEKSQFGETAKRGLGGQPMADQRTAYGHSADTVVSLPKLLLSVSALILAITASFIAWEQFGRAEPATLSSVQLSNQSQPNWDVVTRQLADLAGDNRMLRSELDGLVGPGGVLPRIIERLQEDKRIDAAHRAAIDQLFALGTQRGTLSASPDRITAVQSGGPVEVTPISAAEAGHPQRVIVTPGGETEGQDQ
ncbi:hypothetical protein [Labrenzia sp. DG1229]|uniref:hypothetical protein n=1 Tax=Labrenzia sp. DG1229 TaxID=681847 RepID=UPI0004903CD4|nr:hypothetical protein [Labrenzia sp. DG1229]